MSAPASPAPGSPHLECLVCPSSCRCLETTTKLYNRIEAVVMYCLQLFYDICMPLVKPFSTTVQPHPQLTPWCRERVHTTLVSQTLCSDSQPLGHITTSTYAKSTAPCLSCQPCEHACEREVGRVGWGSCRGKSKMWVALPPTLVIAR